MVEKVGWRGATRENTLPGSATEEQRRQTAFSAETLRAAGLLNLAGVGSVVTAPFGDAPKARPARTSPPGPTPKSLAAAPRRIFRPALSHLPTTGPLFPNLSQFTANDRASRFRRRCERAGVSGVTLHSYRYAWAERAKTVGMPERFAQAALGHNSKAIHRAYAKKAQIIVPSLEEYETKAATERQQPAVAA